MAKAVKALVQLHQKKMRVAQGLSDTKPEHSPAFYWRNEALMQIKSNKDSRHRAVEVESDAIASLYLVLFSQLDGCRVDWNEPFTILCDWLVATGLTSTEEPWLFFQGMSTASRLAVKGTLVSKPILERICKFLIVS